MRESAYISVAEAFGVVAEAFGAVAEAFPFVPRGLFRSESVVADASHEVAIQGDVIEAGWNVVQPVLQAWEQDGNDLQSYPAGSEGPEAAQALLLRDGRQWRSLG